MKNVITKSSMDNVKASSAPAEIPGASTGRTMQGAIALVLELDRVGVQVLSVHEPWLDTGGPIRSLLVAIFGWVAEQERTRLIERIKAGITRAREKGTRSGQPIGRPRVRPPRAAVERLRAQGLSWPAVASALACSVGAARRAHGG